ncbi:hypothetical protein ABEB36_007780 [Hypothenemus hampei]|uniref:Uncharacterized protein n=1 Tax=Hypothenemus hampei TaxID=57062 RepID=A0ABD1EV37_HYPHA
MVSRVWWGGDPRALLLAFHGWFNHTLILAPSLLNPVHCGSSKLKKYITFSSIRYYYLFCHNYEKFCYSGVTYQPVYRYFKLLRHNIYALRYWVCEWLCLINIIVQIVMNYSQQVQETHIHPMIYVFPKVTKCIFHKYVIYRIFIITMLKILLKILHSKHRSILIETCEALCRKVDIGDWWILLMLGTNMDPITYREIIAELAKNIETNRSNQY